MPDLVLTITSFVQRETEKRQREASGVSGMNFLLKWVGGTSPARALFIISIILINPGRAVDGYISILTDAHWPVGSTHDRHARGPVGFELAEG
ncbi:hypothetical protein PoB_006191000 [Plakobranchus ocellatus]|uniref:Uncharacterized protein n=1 Tax=Plakobranchus ocellatus TaxID=259542 RepID=A0AAV4CUD3_9GAST|nr:hypothetical protein PoB_006191000 [Plakobranchus ocellatus]